MKTLAILFSVVSLLLVGCNEEEVNALKEQNASILKDKATLEEKIGNLEKELETLQGENSALEDKLKIAAAKGKSLAGDLAEAEKEILNLQVEKEDIAISNFDRVSEAMRIKNEQRKISNMEAQLSTGSELAKINSEKLQISVKIGELESSKIGKGPITKLEIEKEIVEHRKAQARLDTEAEKKVILGRVRQTIFSEAQKRGLELKQLEEIHASLLKVQTQREWEKIVIDLDQMEKDNDIAKLNEAADASIKALEARKKREQKRTQE